MIEVFVGAGGIGYNVEMTERRPGDDEIVNNAAVVGREQRQSSVIVSQTGDIADDQTLHELDLIAPADPGL